MRKNALLITAVLISLICIVGVASAETTTWTYRGSAVSSGVDSIHAQTPGYYFFAGGHSMRFMQTGNITSVKFYATDVANMTNFTISIWSQDENTLDCTKKSETADMAAQIVNGINVLDFSSSPIVVEEGDSYAVRINGTWNDITGIIPINYAAQGYQAKVYWSQSPSTTDYHWVEQEGRNGSIAMEFYGDAPDAIYIGDSIISGHINSFAFVDQMNDLAKNDEYQMVLPFKVKLMNGWTYQNVGISGDTFPNIANRFENDVLAKHPTYAVIEGGVNNLAGQSMEPEAIFAYYQQMILAAQDDDVVPVVIMVLPAYGHISSAEWSLKADELNDMLFDYQTENPGFILVDAREAIGSWSPVTGWSMDPAYSCDSAPTYVHPNEAGHSILASEIVDAFEEQTSLNGLIYDSLTSDPISGAVVYLYSDDYSASYVTAANGLYRFTVPSDGIYYVQVTAQEYDTVPISLSLNYTGNPKNLDIAMKKAQSYFAPHTVKFSFYEHWYSLQTMQNVSYSIYEGSGTTALKTGTVDNTGSFVVEDMSQSIKYRIVATHTENGITRTLTEYIEPAETSYRLIFGPAETADTGGFAEAVNISVSKAAINTTAANITIAWNDTTANMTSVTSVLSFNGTTIATGNSTNDTGQISLIASNYTGKSYLIETTFVHAIYGTIVRTYSVTFGGSNLPFAGSILLGYLAIFILLIVATQFGKLEHATGSIAFVALAWVFFFLGMFDGFHKNTALELGLTVATLYAIMVYIISRKEGGV